METTLQEMWEEAERNFERLTNKKLRDKKAKTLDDVLGEIDSRTVDDESGGAKVKKGLKKLGKRILNCIQLLGGIAAKGAAMVSPTVLCGDPMD
jgi:fungal STAND N-terminal Goodbye domain